MKFLPPELIDRIIDFLHDDYRTLSKCATVCREWLPSARFHIFQGYRPRLNQELVERSTQIGHLVSKIKISQGFDAGSVSSGLEETTLIGFCKRFPHVDDVLLSGLDEEFWKFQPLLRIISSVPSLRTFGLEYVEIPVRDTVPSEVPRNSIEVLTLNNVDWDLELFMNRAVSTNIFSSVRTLNYKSNHEHHGEGILIFLRHYGPNLIDVCLEKLPSHSTEQIFEVFPCLKNLRKLHIGIRLPEYNLPTLKTWLSAQLPTIFQGITSSTLTTVSLTLLKDVEDGANRVLDTKFRRELNEMVNDVTHLLPKPQFPCVNFTLGLDSSIAKDDARTPPPVITQDHGLCYLSWHLKFT